MRSNEKQFKIKETVKIRKPITYRDYLRKAGYEEKVIRRISNGAYESINGRTQRAILTAFQS